jgi:hypothetical protein
VNTLEESLTMLNPASLDVLIISQIDRLQTIEDPRIRMAVLTYMFALYLDAVGVDRKRALEIVDRGLRYARDHNTSEMRGLAVYLRKECRDAGVQDNSNIEYPY